ncbi:MAG: HNH endonuclease, partial [bacterium]
MVNLEKDSLIRIAAFQWLKQKIDVYGDTLPWTLLTQGFSFQGERVPLIGYTGIWKPKVCELPISITTTLKNPYKDDRSNEDFINYRYRGEDSNHRDNRGLREIWQRQIPLIYFAGTRRKGYYQVFFPMYIEEDMPDQLMVRITSGAMTNTKEPGTVNEPLTEYNKLLRSYRTQEVKSRIHQQELRDQIIQVYRNQCAICKLKHTELLDAAHIIADTLPLGDAIIQNGISLCKIHHAAFDNNILGINPDFGVEVRKDVLQEKDGPMLQHGLKDFHKSNLILPYREAHYPDRERIEIRYAEFKRTG